MELREGECVLEIVHTDTSSPVGYTVRFLGFSVGVSSHGFAGNSQLWTDTASFDQFLADLRELESRRQGAARLESHEMPEEFWLEFRAIDRAGRTAVVGRLHESVQMGVDGGHHEQALEFGFEFCPSRLIRMLAEFRAMTGAAGLGDTRPG